MSTRKKTMITPREQAWRALKIAEGRLSDAAIVIADSLAFDGKPPTDEGQEYHRYMLEAFANMCFGVSEAITMEDKLEEYRSATKALVLAYSKYSKIIENEVKNEIEKNIGKVMKDLARAHRKYAKTIKNEAGK